MADRKATVGIVMLLASLLNPSLAGCAQQRPRATAPPYTWTESKMGVQPDHVTGLVCLDNGWVVASLMNQGLLVSKDQGKHWSKTDKGIAKCDHWCLAADSEGVLYHGTGRGLFVSYDSGQHWVLQRPGITKDSVTALAVDNRDAVYALTPKNKLSVSVNQGKKWRQLCADIKNTHMMGYVLRTDSQRNVYGTLGDTIYKHGTGDSGWHRTGLDPGRGWVYAVACDRDRRVFVGLRVPQYPRMFPAPPPTQAPVLFSSNAGKTWTPLWPDKEARECYALATSRDGSLYVSTDLGIFLTRDIGKIWTRVVDTSGTSAYKMIAVDKQGRVYGVGPDGKVCCGVPRKDL